MINYVAKVDLKRSVAETYNPVHALCGLLEFQFAITIYFFTQEMILALVIQLVGVMLYGYCLGAIAATLANVASSRYS